MKTITFLFLVGVGLMAADDVSLVSTVKTSKVGTVVYKDYVTRNGKTNLVRSITKTNDVVTRRLHLFYHDGQLVGSHSSASGRTAVSTFGGYSVDFHSTNDVPTDVFVSDKDHRYLEMFSITNGVLTPWSSAEWRKAVGRAATNAERRTE